MITFLKRFPWPLQANLVDESIVFGSTKQILVDLIYEKTQQAVRPNSTRTLETVAPKNKQPYQ